MQALARWLQCSTTAALACVGWAAFPTEPNPKARLIIALVVGFGGHWLLMFSLVWLRYGWRSARSMRLEGND